MASLGEADTGETLDPSLRERIVEHEGAHKEASLAMGGGIKSYETPQLETPRLVLRPLRIDDAADAFERWASDPDVARYMSWSLHRSIYDTLTWLGFECATLASPDNFTFGYVLKGTGGLIGSGGIHFSDEYHGFELGYNLMKEQWGKGYATEAARRILDFATDELGIATFHASHATDNTASGNVLSKLGFTYTGDGFFTSADGKRAFPNKKYRLDIA
ncbi:MAG: GNAT family N-acetyltransferase [Eggerthellaceae bacterium]|nr:GNAT family N-acetyltransferase [Eggerthellaceae bacterium]